MRCGILREPARIGAMEAVMSLGVKARRVEGESSREKSEGRHRIILLEERRKT